MINLSGYAVDPIRMDKYHTGGTSNWPHEVHEPVREGGWGEQDPLYTTGTGGKLLVENVLLVRRPAC